MDTETFTVYTVNETGLADIREHLERFGKYPATDGAVRAYAANAEQDLSDSCGIASAMEIRASHSKSGNPVTFELPIYGWDENEVDGS